MRPFLVTLALAGLSSASGLTLQMLPPLHLPGSGGLPAPVSVPAAAATPFPESQLVLAATPQSVPNAPVSAVLASALATAPAAAAQPPPAAAVATATEAGASGATLDSFPRKAAALYDVMNTARLERGLQPLAHSSVLDEVALVRANDLVKNGYFDHVSPSGQSAFTELSAMAVRYRIAGENLARNNYADGHTVQAAFDALMASPGHRANILEERFGLVGVAAVRDGQMWLYVTIFMD